MQWTEVTAVEIGWWRGTQNRGDVMWSERAVGIICRVLEKPNFILSVVFQLFRERQLFCNACVHQIPLKSVMKWLLLQKNPFELIV